MAEDKYDLIIIGGGPAGMTAGIYASRLNLKTLLITKSFGGQVSSKAVDIENYPGFGSVPGSFLVKKIEEHLKVLPIMSELDEVKRVKKEDSLFLVSTKGSKSYLTEAVILASGAESRKLNIPGEKEYTGKGVSYCSVCDGPLFKNKTVAIIGGGNAGFETAIFLVNIAKKIYILEYANEPKAFEQIQRIAKESDKIDLIVNAKAKEVKGAKLVNSLIYEDVKTKEERVLNVEGVFVEVGYSPSFSYVEDLVDCNGEGEIKIDPKTCQTKTPGLFAAGDLNDGKFKQIIIAAGEGAKAALSAYGYIKKKTIEK